MDLWYYGRMVKTTGSEFEDVGLSLAESGRMLVAFFSFFHFLRISWFIRLSVLFCFVSFCFFSFRARNSFWFSTFWFSFLLLL